MSFPQLADFTVSDKDAAFVARVRKRLDEVGLRMPSIEAKNALYGEGQNYVRVGLHRKALLCYLLAVDATYGEMLPSEVTTYQNKSRGIDRRVVDAQDVTSELKNAGSCARTLGAHRLALALYTRALEGGRSDMFLMLTYTHCLMGQRDKARYWALRGAHVAGFDYFVTNAMSYLESPPEDMTYESLTLFHSVIEQVIDEA